MNEIENVAATVLRELPQPITVFVESADKDPLNTLKFIALPNNYKLEKVDHDALLPNPRRIKAHATLSDRVAFVDYVKRYARLDTTVVWVDFNPQNSALSFTAVFDDHAPASTTVIQPGWRGHRSAFKPELSPEWKHWTAKDKQAMGQLEFAQFLEDHVDDVVSPDGYSWPTSQQILQMATNFEYRSEMRLKSANKAQSGATVLEYVNGEDQATGERMELFKEFRLGLPVFWNGPAYGITAKLRYRVPGGKLSFWYELQRADKVHEHASRELIDSIRTEVGEHAEVLLGSST